LKQWIETGQIEPSELEGTVTARCGSSVMFVAFSPVTGWRWIYPGGMEVIAEPPLLFLEPGWAKAHPRKSAVVRTEKPRVRRRKTEQLLFDL